ncbi:MAG: hypothetical protein V3V95_07915 [Thermodesulfobacteriota bacterium]
MNVADIINGKWTAITEPILGPGGPKAWDGLSAITPGIFQKGVSKKYGIFYSGLSSVSGTWGIGYAESDDLMHWEKHPANPVLIYEDDENYIGFDSPCLVKRNGIFHLFCEEKKFKKTVRGKVKQMLPMNLRLSLGRLRRSFRNEEGAVSVQHADGRYFVSFTSNNLLKWSLSSRRLILEKGKAGNFDSSGLFSSQVHELDGRYYMFYGGSNGSVTSTGLAVSDDLSKWTRSDASPILKPGGSGEWDENNALMVSVLRMEDGYCGFYEGEDAQNTYRIGLAYSYDLSRWEKCEGNPIVETGTKGSFNERMSCSPHIFSDNGQVVLFHSGHDRNMRGSCGVAVFERN